MQARMHVRMRLRILVLALALLLAPVLAAPFAPVRGAGAYVGQVWHTTPIYFGRPGVGANADFVIYPARSGHLRFWFMNPANYGDWKSRDAPVFTCTGSVSCWVYAQVPGIAGYVPDHVDLIGDDYYDGGGGYIQDAGPL